MRRTLFITGLLMLFGIIAPAQIAASPGLMTEDLTGPLTSEDLVDALVGTGIATSAVTYSGAERAAGTFTGGTGIIGFEQGVILSSGDIANVVGPNVSDSISASNGTPGDADLTALAGQDTEDAAILEFDFVPDDDMVFFEYVFASDEYNEFVGQFNDVFGFFVNGANCATVNGQPVSINTINLSSNSSLYRNNDPSDTTPSIDTEMDGLTVVLTCEAPVDAGATNHIKLAIADAGDSALDSNVFLKTGSFSTTPPGEEGPDLSVEKADSPDPVTGGGIVQYLASVSNAGPGASSVTLTDTPSDGEIVSIGGAGWTCDNQQTSATCTLDDPLDEGETAPDVEILVEAPGVEEETTIENTATVEGDGEDPSPDDNTHVEETTVRPAGEDEVITFCPPSGCQFNTGEEPTEDDPTVNKVTVPEGGDGSVTRLSEGVTTFPCGGNTSTGDEALGQETDFAPPTGLVDAENPIVVETIWDVSVWPVDKNNDPGLGNSGKGDARGKVKICMEKEVQTDGGEETVIFRIPFCEPLRSGVADPSPCINDFFRDGDLDMHVEFNMLSEDPRWRR